MPFLAAIILSGKVSNPEELMRKLRSSVIITGTIISGFGEARFSSPEGCDVWAIHHLCLMHLWGMIEMQWSEDIYLSLK